MPDQLFEFRWQIEESGYDWLTAPLANNRDKSDCFLTSGHPVGVSCPVVEYSPLREHTGLFRDFAALELKRDSVRKFANTYGLLGGDAQSILVPGKGSIQVRLREQEPGKEETPLTLSRGETLSYWGAEILAMCKALQFWDMIVGEEKEDLAKYVQWSAPDVVKAQFPDGGFTLIASSQVRSHRLQQIPGRDVLKPATFYVQDTINKHLNGRVSPRLLWGRDWSELGLCFVPNSLIGAFWLQFARAVDGNKKYGRCLECHAWFEFSPDVARTNRKYCKNACRFKAYRRRQAEARRLFAEGMPVKKIAAQLKSKTATIKSWIASAN